MSLDVGFYVQRFLRRLPYFLILAIIGTASGLTLARVLPPVFRAEARLLFKKR